MRESASKLRTLVSDHKERTRYLGLKDYGYLITNFETLTNANKVRDFPRDQLLRDVREQSGLIDLSRFREEEKRQIEGTSQNSPEDSSEEEWSSLLFLESGTGDEPQSFLSPLGESV